MYRTTVRRALAIAALALVGATLTAPSAQAGPVPRADAHTSDVSTPIVSSAFRSGGPLPYSVLAAGWWKWVLEEPIRTNPLLDTTGENCAHGQPRALVWYLAGAPSSAPVQRTCRVPAGRALFVPVVNLFYGAFLNDPPETRTDDFVRAQVACISNSTGTLTVDGRTIPRSLLVSERSPIFSVQLPDENIFGLSAEQAPDLVLSPSADEGTYALLPPLRRGTHTIRIQAAITEPCPFNQTIDVTYTLDVN